MPGGFGMRLSAVSATMILGGAVLCLAACQPKPTAAPGALLGWAYPQGQKSNLPPYPAGPQRIPGSAVTYTGEALNKGAGPPDWFPDSHPPAPEVVAQGRKGLMACAECHQIGGGVEKRFQRVHFARLNEAEMTVGDGDFRCARHASEDRYAER